MAVTIGYGEAYSRLTFETAIVAFEKANGFLRTMLCTRNTSTAALISGGERVTYAGLEGKCNNANGNIAVIDLELLQARSININRAINIEFVGMITSVEELRKVLEDFEKYSEAIKGDSEAARQTKI